MPWEPNTTKPPENIVVAVLDMHWKKEGWLSAAVDFGRVVQPENGPWYIENIDDRGEGHMVLESDVDFSHWIRVSELPDLPEV